MHTGMVEHIKRPAFSYYGSKFRLAKRYPTPLYDTIVEPFAGAAGYSLRHYQHRVVLIDAYDVVCAVWRYLIGARFEEIISLPLLGPDSSVDDFNIPQEAKWLIGFWLNSACAQPVKKYSSWGKTKTFGHWEKDSSKPEWATRTNNQFWTFDTRLHVASVSQKVKHWRVLQGSYVDSVDVTKATWFVDPPYQKAGRYYKHSSAQIDYTQLAAFCRSLIGQVIVTENEGALWLPFSPLCTSRSASGKMVNGKKRCMTNKEVVWISENFE